MSKTSAADWVRDAVHCLREYQKYGEAMREHGRGFEPTGMLGHNVETVIIGAAKAASVLDNFAIEAEKAGY